VSIGRTYKTLVIGVLICAFLIIDLPAQSASLNQDEAMLRRVIRLVRENYVREVGESELVQYAVEGLVKSVDPYAAYLTPDMLPEYEKRAAQPFGPLGMALTLDEGILTVVSVAENSPAAKAGIEPKDRLLKIDGQPAKGMTLIEAWKAMNGPAGSKISITVAKKRSQKPKDLIVKRDPYFIEPVRTKLLDNRYFYVRLADFQEGTDSALRAAIDRANSKGEIKGLILDLRNNPGGILERSLGVAAMFTDKPVLGYAERKSAKKEDIVAPRNGTPYAFDVAILINEGAAGGSEVIAGALQDYDRALILGSQSFGRACIQSLIPLGNGASISLTTAYISTPKGKGIQRNGITPDVEFKPAEEESGKTLASMKSKRSESAGAFDPGKDPLVKMALDWLKSGKQVSEAKGAKQ
jgi:carboxyl-terminal processing protease